MVPAPKPASDAPSSGKSASPPLLQRRGRQLTDIAVPELTGRPEADRGASVMAEDVARKVIKASKSSKPRAIVPLKRKHTREQPAAESEQNVLAETEKGSPAERLEALEEPAPWTKTLRLIDNAIAVMPVGLLVDYFATEPKIRPVPDHHLSIAMMLTIRQELSEALEQIYWHDFKEDQVKLLLALADYCVGLRESPPPNCSAKEMKDTAWFEYAFRPLREVANFVCRTDFAPELEVEWAEE